MLHTEFQEIEDPVPLGMKKIIADLLDRVPKLRLGIASGPVELRPQ